MHKFWRCITFGQISICVPGRFASCDTNLADLLRLPHSWDWDLRSMTHFTAYTRPTRRVRQFTVPTTYSILQPPQFSKTITSERHWRYMTVKGSGGHFLSARTHSVDLRLSAMIYWNCLNNFQAKCLCTFGNLYCYLPVVFAMRTSLTEEVLTLSKSEVPFGAKSFSSLKCKFALILKIVSHWWTKFH